MFYVLRFAHMFILGREFIEYIYVYLLCMS